MTQMREELDGMPSSCTVPDKPTLLSFIDVDEMPLARQTNQPASDYPTFNDCAGIRLDRAADALTGSRH